MAVTSSSRRVRVCELNLREDRDREGSGAGRRESGFVKDLVPEEGIEPSRGLSPTGF